MTVELIGGELKVTNGPEYFVIEDKKSANVFPSFDGVKSSGIEPRWAIIKNSDGFVLSKNFLPLKYKMDERFYDEKGTEDRFESEYYKTEDIVKRLNEGLSPWPLENVKKRSRIKWVEIFAVIAIGILTFLFYNR